MKSKKQIFRDFERKAARKFETRALPDLIEQRNNLVEEMENIIKDAEKETRALTDDETSRFDEIKKEIDGIDKTLKAQNEARSLSSAEFGGAKKENMEQRAADEAKFEKFLRGETRALSTSANSGKALIPTTIADRIIERVKELSPIYSMATIYNVGGNLSFPVYDDTTDTGATLVEDMQELTESSGKFTTITLENYIVGVLKLISKSLINQSGFDLVSFTINKVAENIAEFLEKGLLNGQKNKYQGVFETTNLVTSAIAKDIIADELIDVQMTVPQQFQQNACWIMNKETLAQIRKLKDNEGNYLLNRDITKEFGWELLGKPVYVSENAPKIAASTTTIVYGDMSGLYVKLANAMEINVLLEKYATQYAIGVCGYTEFDSKIVESQKIAGLKMKAA